ncbi:YcxB family protein [Sulfuriflexus mobilis]|uniref:YcxB family protein n=1 Tax=Sulfuriflexus mobilis TaxID=1811807 RepID=UPI000F843FF8|nr:YcxB family protein [Sulfuriflexus mobilis]
MKLEYSVSRNEMGAITRSITHAIWKRPENNKRKYFLQAISILLWIPVGIFIAYSFRAKGDEFASWAIYAVAMTVAVVWGYRLLERYILNTLPAEPGSSLGPMNLKADASGVTVETSNTASFTKWSGIKAIEASGEYVLLFIDNHAAHYLPQRAIGSETEVSSFITALQSLKNDYATNSIGSEST